LVELKAAKESSNTAEIKRLTEQLQQMSYALAQQQQAGGQAGPPPSQNGQGEEVIEGEFQ
jgi:hypothetical protein